MTDARHSSADDEALSAWLDGALPASESEQLMQRVAREPLLAARLAELERANETLRNAYRSVVDEPLPREVVNLLSQDRAEPAGAESGDRRVVTFAPRQRAARRPLFPLALAAGIALAIGVALGVLVAARAPSPAALIAGVGPVEAGTLLHDVLDHQPSGTRRELGANVTAEPRLTFATTTGEYCRRVDFSDDRGATTTLACRHGDAWQVEIASFSRGTPNGGGLYRPAGAEASAVDDAIDSLISGEPFGAAAERAAIDRGWAPTQ